MTEQPRPKPLPARPASPPSGEPSQATGTQPPAVPQSDAHAPPPPGPDPEVAELRVSGRGGSWRVSVLGRSGRASARSAALMLLGFSPEEAGASAPILEATVAGRRLGELSEDALQAALARAVALPTENRRRPFFEDADQGGRS